MPKLKPRTIVLAKAINATLKKLKERPTTEHESVINKLINRINKTANE